MNKFGFEHLKYSPHTYKQRQFLIIIGCLSILVFEYHIAQDLTIYNVSIPGPLIKLSLIFASVWTTIQFVFSSVDDFINWKSVFLIDENSRPKNPGGPTTIMLELDSFSKGKIRYNVQFAHSWGGNVPKLDLEKAEAGLKSTIEQLERRLKGEIQAIETFKNWYKHYSWFTIFRFSVIEFALPLVFTLYAVFLCQYFPLLPK